MLAGELGHLRTELGQQQRNACSEDDGCEQHRQRPEPTGGGVDYAAWET